MKKPSIGGVLRSGRIGMARRGFTLAEILIVAAMIALLSGIGIFAINEMYNSNIRKVTIAECAQLATALSIAEQDLQFYPRFNYFNRSKNLITFGSTTEVVPRLDYYGFLSSTPAILLRIQDNWKGPYMGVSATRNRSSRGQSGGLIQVRLPDMTPFQGQDISLVDWPADVYGQPYLLMQLKSVIVGGSVIPSFIERESEEGDFRNSIISYGKNGVPGGNENTDANFIASTLLPGALYVKGDTVAGGPAKFTIRTATATDPNLRLENNTAVHTNFLKALSVQSTNPTIYNVDAGRVGMIDTGSDDNIFEF